ncbi:MAG: MBL fold metallo-hydrolase [Clostridiales bacterium]|nr:MBL fold metallo-hydrolase [Clostridiales bacterium]
MKKVIKSIITVLLTFCSIISTILMHQLYLQKANSPTLTLIGHASVKLKSIEGKVIYIDPYFPVGEYDEPADFILVTHEHSDHNNINLCKKAEDCLVIRYWDALIQGEYQTFEKDGIKIEAVPSGGNSHSVKESVGFIVTVDGVRVYHAGDTSMNEGKYEIAKKEIDYAMYPVDGVYNMGPEEATQVADLIGATYNIPIHGFGKNYYQQFKDFSAKGKIFMNRGETILLHR